MRNLSFLFLFFHQIIDIPADIVGQAAETGGLGRGQLAVRDLVLQDFLDSFSDLVEDNIIHHRAVF